MKLRKILLTSLLALSVTAGLVPTATVHAEESDFFEVVESELVDGTFVEDTAYRLARGNFLSSGTMQLSNKGNRVLALSGNTSCHVVCDKVTCNLYLEQMDENGNWYTYKYWRCSMANTSCYSPERSVTVDGGHWYRARGAHIAVKDGTSESVSTTTNGIWVS